MSDLELFLDQILDDWMYQVDRDEVYQALDKFCNVFAGILARRGQIELPGLGRFLAVQHGSKWDVMFTPERRIVEMLNAPPPGSEVSPGSP